RMAPLDPVAARAVLQSLFGLWRDGMNAPLPTACKTALALLQDGDPALVYDGAHQISGESDQPCLARLWPDFASLAAQARWHDVSSALYGPLVDWLTHHVVIEDIVPDDAAEDEGTPS
ncbi:MAG: exodeoxyribonuclease V gamma subunit, partial [Janthinobacterium sp.]